MTLFELVRFFLECAAVILCVYGVYHEKSLIKFERMLGRYIKGFFKAVVYTVRDRISEKSKHTEKRLGIKVDFTDYEELLALCETKTFVQEVKIAS